MKKIMKQSLYLFIIVAGIALLTIGISAEESMVSYGANDEGEKTMIHSQAVNGKEYLFLPSSADLSKLVLNFENAQEIIIKSSKNEIKITNGTAFDLTLLFEEEQDEYNIMIIKDKTENELTIMKSSNLRSVYLVSEDEINQGRAWVDSDKSNKAKGYISIVGIDGEIDYSDSLTQIKGRGNTTFNDFNKKPYQIKLKSKADLINNEKNEENKTWLLLANMFDYTFIHNSITFQLAKDLNMAYTPNFEAVDLYYDKEYRGTYLLCEKTEVDEERIDIEDLDDAIEETNKDNPAYEKKEIITATIASKGNDIVEENSQGSYKYIADLIEPKLKEGTSHHGYLLELEFNKRYLSEATGFKTVRNQAVVSKNPEYLTQETGAYISNFWQEFEDAVYSENGYNRSTGKYYYDYVDLQSLVKLYLINELCKNYDGFHSSMYFYLPEDEDKLYAGPVWDYDLAYGVAYKERTEVTKNPENLYLSDRYLVEQLLYIESFRQAVKEQLDAKNGEFYHAVQKMIEENGTISLFSKQVSQSKKLNSILWDSDLQDYIVLVQDGKEKNYNNAVAYLEEYVSIRIEWLQKSVKSWKGKSYILVTDYGTYKSTSKTIWIEKITAFFD